MEKEDVERRVEELMMSVLKYNSLNEAITSKEFWQMLKIIADQRVENGMIDELAKRIYGYNKNKAVNVGVNDNEMAKVIALIYNQAFTIGFNAGIIITLDVVKALIQNVLLNIDNDYPHCLKKIARIYTYFFKDGKTVNEFERAVIKFLHEQGFSFREISEIVNRSLDTIHRVVHEKS